MKEHITLAEADRLRRTPGATVVLFLTDRCPVGCEHCSVLSSPDSAAISDWPLFVEVVAGICDMSEVRAVAITGGEPFSERRGLTYAVNRLSAAGKAVVVFTSGYWARHRVLPWVESVLGLTATVFLSTDSFHQRALDPGRSATRRATGLGPIATRAATTIIDSGCHLVLQVLDEPGLAAAARSAYPAADVSVIPPLSLGRGAHLFHSGPERELNRFGRCGLVAAATIRYDGTVTACCNEAVIMGAGPSRLRQRVNRSSEIRPAVARLRADPVLQVMGRFGPSRLSPLVDGSYTSICQPCWLALERTANGNDAAGRSSVSGRTE